MATAEEPEAFHVRPGRAHDRPPFVHPVRLYLVVNLVFFFVVPWLNTEYGTIWSMDSQALAVLHPAYARLQTEQASSLDLTPEQYATWFDLQTRAAQGAFVAVMIPVFGAWLWLLFRRRRRYLVDHLLLATSAFTVFLLWLIALGLFARVVIAFGGGSNASAVIMAGALMVWLAAQAVWLFGGLRRFYGLAFLPSLALVGPVFIAFLSPFYLYMHLLFWSSWLALHSV